MLPLVDALALPWRAIVYALAFLVGLGLLERGADWFVDAIAACNKAGGAIGIVRAASRSD